MIFREALISDIKQMHVVRLAVRENILSNPDLITQKDYEEFLTQRGKGWLCEIDNVVVGFSIVDLKEKDIWALFVHPQYEGNGVGKKLQKLMLDWYFNQTKENIHLTTAANTHAEKFYKSTGWIETGRAEKFPSNPAFPPYIDVRFEMTFEDWNKK